MANTEKYYIQILELAMDNYNSLNDFLSEGLDRIDIEDDEVFCIIECDLIDSWYKRKGFSPKDYSCCVRRGYTDNWFMLSYKDQTRKKRNDRKRP